MKTSISMIIVAALSIFGVGAALASETAQKPAVEQTDVKVELKKLLKAAGAGEISMKEYNIRKQALLATEQAQQIGDASK